VSIDDATYPAILARLREIHQESNKPETLDLSASADEGSAKPPNRSRFPIPERLAKEEGELAEAAYVHISWKNGIRNAKPEGETLTIDRVAIFRRPARFNFSGVQVKCTSYHLDYAYKLNLWREGLRPYQPGDFDFLAALVVPEDAWYVIPFHALRSRTAIYFHPRATSAEDLGDCDRYRDRWDLLR
jgi:hypothetical protein